MTAPECDRLPRVLVVNVWPFTRRTNMGITLCNLFEGYPPERLAAVDLCPSCPAESGIPGRLWRSGRPLLDGFSLRRPWPQFPRDTGRVSPAYQSGQYAAKESPSFSSSRLKARVGPLLNELASRVPGFFSREFVRWVEEFRPEVVFSQAAPGHLVRLLIGVSERWSLPIVPHVTDDYLDWYPAGPAVGKAWLQFLARRRFARMLRRAPVRLVISQAMAREYGRRYGGQFETVMNPAALAPAGPPSHGGRRPFRLVYAGVLEPDRWRVLAAVGEALAQLANRLEIRLDLYSLPSDIDQHRLALSAFAGIHLAGFVPQNRLPAILQNADALLHVESFQPAAIQRTRLAMSTKIGLYLACGRPVVAIGPSEAASMQHLIEVGAGPVLNTAEPAVIAAALATLASDPVACGRFCCQARDGAQTWHDPDVVRRKVWNLLRQARELWEGQGREPLTEERVS